MKMEWKKPVACAVLACTEKFCNRHGFFKKQMKHTANENANKPSFIRARIYNPMYGKKWQEHNKNTPNQTKTEPNHTLPIPKRNETSKMLVGKGENWQKDANEPNSLFVAFNTFNSVYFSFLQHTNFAWHGMALSHIHVHCTLYRLTSNAFISFHFIQFLGSSSSSSSRRTMQREYAHVSIVEPLAHYTFLYTSKLYAATVCKKRHETLQQRKDKRFKLNTYERHSHEPTTEKK